MYKLTTYKSLVVPEGFTTGQLDFYKAFSYLTSLGMNNEAMAMLFALKAVVVPEGSAVIYTPEGKNPSKIPAGSGVPIYLGRDNTTWEGFAQYVAENPENTTWQIVNEEDAEDIEFDQEYYVALMSRFRESMIQSLDAGDYYNTVTLLEYLNRLAAQPEKDLEEARKETIVQAGDSKETREKKKEMRDAAEERYNKTRRVQVSATRLAEQTHAELVYRHVLQSKNITELERQVEEAFTPRMEYLAERLKDVDGTWKLEYRKADTTYFTATRNNNAIEAKRGYVPVLVRYEGERDLSDLMAVLALSNYNGFTTEELTPGSDSSLLDKNGVMHLEDVGVAAETLVGEAPMEVLDKAVGLTSRLATLITLRELAGLERREKIASRHALDALVTDPRNLENTYVKKGDIDSQEAFFNAMVFTARIDQTFEQGVAVSQGVSAVDDNWSEPVREGAHLLVARSREKASEFLFGKDGWEPLEDALGIKLNETHRTGLSSAIENMSAEEINKLMSKNNDALAKEVMSAMGITRGRVSSSQAEQISDSVRSLQKRILARKELEYASWSARLGGMYTTDGHYFRRGVSWVVNHALAGESVSFDEYSQSFVGDESGRIVPLAYLDLIGGQAIGFNTDTNDIELSPTQEEYFKSRYNMTDISGDNLLDLLYAASKDGGYAPSALYSQNIISSNADIKNQLAENNGGKEFSPDMVEIDTKENPRLQSTVQDFAGQIFGRIVDNDNDYDNSTVELTDALLEAETRAEVARLIPQVAESIANNVVTTYKETFGAGVDSQWVKDLVTKDVNDKLTSSLGNKKEVATGKSILSGAYGVYFEGVQSIAAMVGLVGRSGASGATETKLGFEWEDPTGVRHIYSRNPKSGAIDAIYTTLGKDGTLTVEPIELKLSDTHDAIAHLGTTTDFYEPKLQELVRDTRAKKLVVSSTNNFSQIVSTSRKGDQKKKPAEFRKRLKGIVTSVLSFKVPFFQYNRTKPVITNEEKDPTPIGPADKSRGASNVFASSPNLMDTSRGGVRRRQDVHPLPKKKGK